MIFAIVLFCMDGMFVLQIVRNATAAVCRLSVLLQTVNLRSARAKTTRKNLPKKFPAKKLLQRKNHNPLASPLTFPVPKQRGYEVKAKPVWISIPVFMLHFFNFEKFLLLKKPDGNGFPLLSAFLFLCCDRRTAKSVLPAFPEESSKNALFFHRLIE